MKLVLKLSSYLPILGLNLIKFDAPAATLDCLETWVYLYEANRKSFVSQDCNTAAYTSSLMWVKLYFPSLLRQKWHADNRDMMMGDICLQKDSNVYRGEWRLCEVAKVFQDDGRKVRNVQVMVKPRQGGAYPYISTKLISRSSCEQSHFTCTS